MTYFMKKPSLIENNPVGLAAGFDKNCEVLIFRILDSDMPKLERLPPNPRAETIVRDYFGS